MEIKTFHKILTTAKKRYCRTPFAEQLFAERFLVEHLSITASIKLKTILFNRL